MEISKMTLMPKIAQRATLLLAFTLYAATSWGQFTNPRPMVRAADEYFALLLKSDFSKLERTAEEARAKDLRISDGQPVLAALYEGTAGCACANSLTDELWQTRRTRLEAWRDQFPRSITARVALAAFPVYYGWFARGNNYARSVSPDNWKMFGERVEAGRVALDALDTSAKQDEGWYAAMISVALAQHWPSQRFDTLYEEGARKHPAYLPIHFNAANYYAPQWYGSQQAYSRFVDRAVQLVGSQLGTQLYARMNWSQGTDTMFQDSTADWKRMKNGFEQIIQGYPDPWNLNNFARFACIAHDWSTMNALAEKIGEAPVAMAWYDDSRIYFGCRTMARKST
jgi:hypothetical protein